MPTPLSDGDGYTVGSLCPGVTELCLFSADSSFYAHWGICIYDPPPRRIWPLCLSHYVPHHGRNAAIHHRILKFCKWAVTNWTDQGETQETKHPLLLTTVYLCFIKSHIHKREPDLCLRALPPVVWLLSKQHCCIIALCYSSIQSVPQLWLMNQMMCQASGQLMITWDTDRVNRLVKELKAMHFELTKTWLRYPKFFLTFEFSRNRTSI